PTRRARAAGISRRARSARPKRSTGSRRWDRAPSNAKRAPPLNSIMRAITMTARIDDKAQAIATALAQIGEPISEAAARDLADREACECRDGMFALAPSRRALFGGAALVAGVGMTAMLPRGAAAKP